jgi:transcriptional regulator with XRE-family HTH domain
MSVRVAFAAALQFLRGHLSVSQRDIAQTREQSYVSKLEAGSRAVTLEVAQDLAQAMKIDPLALLTLVYASDRGKSPRQVLVELNLALENAGLLDVNIPSQPGTVPHPVDVSAAATKTKIHELIAQGLNQAEVARRLGISRQSVSRHLRKSKS